MADGNGMVERAAAAIADKWLEKVDDIHVRIGPPVIARAALLAALDPEDESLVLEVAGVITGEPISEFWKSTAALIITTLRTRVQGVSGS